MTLGVAQLLKGSVLILEIDLHLHEGSGFGLERTEVDLYIEECGSVELDEEVTVLFYDVDRDLYFV